MVFFLFAKYFPLISFFAIQIKYGKGKILNFITMLMLLVRSVLFIVVHLFLFRFVPLSYFYLC